MECREHMFAGAVDERSNALPVTVFPPVSYFLLLKLEIWKRLIKVVVFRTKFCNGEVMITVLWITGLLINILTYISVNRDIA